MKYNPDIHKRRSLRLKNYAYAQQGAYFVTICTKNRDCLLGEIIDGGMKLNDAGFMVLKWWGELKNKFRVIELDECIIMPNHFHGIIIIVEAGHCIHDKNRTSVGVDLCVYPDSENHVNKGHCTNKGAHTGAPLHRVIQWFKTMTTNEYIKNVYEKDWNRLHGKLWQRNYYDRIIRNENEFTKIRKYIRNNPGRWDMDEDNPTNLQGFDSSNPYLPLSLI